MRRSEGNCSPVGGSPHDSHPFARRQTVHPGHARPRGGGSRGVSRLRGRLMTPTPSGVIWQCAWAGHGLGGGRWELSTCRARLLAPTPSANRGRARGLAVALEGVVTPAAPRLLAPAPLSSGPAPRHRLVWAQASRWGSRVRSCSPGAPCGSHPHRRSSSRAPGRE